MVGTMDIFAKKVLEFIQDNKMICTGDIIVVGFSGGADSTALMDVLGELRDILKIDLRPLHVNHGIRQEAAEDEQFVKDYCSKRAIPIRVVCENVPRIAKRRGITEEEAGRQIRYRAFTDYAKELGAGRIAVAHHQNDVAETLLMNLSRGSGLRGAGAIRPVRDMIIRPLLGVGRAEIEEYLERRGQPFCTDRTNFENEHTRNIIRNCILPEFERSINSKSISHMCRAAASVSEAEEYIRSVAKKEFEISFETEKEGLRADLGNIRPLPEIIRKNIILICFEQLIASRKDFSYEHLTDVLELIDGKCGSACVSLPYGLIAERNYDSFFIGKRGNDTPEMLPISLKLREGEETIVAVPGLGQVRAEVFAYDKAAGIPGGAYTKWFDYDRIQAVVFRTRKKMDVISISQKDGIHKKRLAKFMTDEKIPERERNLMYILADGNEVLWVPGYRRCDICKVGSDTERILAITIMNGGNTNG